MTKFVPKVWICDTDKNTDRTDGCRGLLRAFSMHQEELSGKVGIELAI